MSFESLDIGDSNQSFLIHVDVDEHITKAENRNIPIPFKQTLKNRIFVFKYSQTCLNVKGTTKKITTNEILTQI